MDNWILIGLSSGLLALVSFGGAVRETLIIVVKQQLHIDQ